MMTSAQQLGRTHRKHALPHDDGGSHYGASAQPPDPAAGRRRRSRVGTGAIWGGGGRPMARLGRRQEQQNNPSCCCGHDDDIVWGQFMRPSMQPAAPQPWALGPAIDHSRGACLSILSIPPEYIYTRAL